MCLQALINNHAPPGTDVCLPMGQCVVVVIFRKKIVYNYMMSYFMYCVVEHLYIAKTREECVCVCVHRVGRRVGEKDDECSPFVPQPDPSKNLATK